VANLLILKNGGKKSLKITKKFMFSKISEKIKLLSCENLSKTTSWN
jgi:hypothetical protein